MQIPLADIERLLDSGSLLAYPAVFAGGLLASLTPCFYLLSLAYVVGIASTYAALGMIAALTGKIFGSVNLSAELGAEIPVMNNNTSLQIVPDYKIHAAVTRRF
jgi:hypothetical protein